MSVRGSPMTVGESADQSQRVVPQAGMPAPGAIQVGSMDAMEMPANTPHRVTPQPGMPAAGTLNVQPVEMPADTPQSTVVRQAGRTAVAGQMTLKEVLERNPEITEVRLQQVTQTPSGGALKSLGSMARNALLQRLQGGVGGSSMD
jgi:hypothetical protein